jgi:hypothetical protein
MATEQLTYDHLAERLGTTREAARASVSSSPSMMGRSHFRGGGTSVASTFSGI